MESSAPTSPAKGPDRVRLFEMATGQGGYFTAQQARQCGFSWALLSHHVTTGSFSRVRHGLYRFRDYPSPPREEVLAAWLAVGKDVAVVSHESALDLLDLSDMIPDAVHLTVPRCRRRLPSMWGVKIHTTMRPIQPGERWVRDGMVITSASRSILDAAEKAADPEQIELAVVQAVERGLTAPQQLRREAGERSRRVARLVANALERTVTE